VLRGLSLASFTGSGQNSVQAVATDSIGNIYLAGTTSSPDFPVKNAAQPTFGDARIMRSTDFGATWKPVGSPPADVKALAVDPVTPQVLFAGGSSAIYKSADGGQTWRRVYAFQPGYLFSAAGLVIDPGNHLRVAALAPLTSQVIRSVDGGETWTAGASPCSFGNCGGQLIADPTGSGALLLAAFGLRISRDWGLTFQDRNPPMGAPSTAAFDPSHPGWIYADTGAGVTGTLWLSTDFGATWAQKASPPSTFSLLIYLAVDPDQPNTLVAAAADALYKSTNGASSWTRQTAPSSFSVETHDPFALVSHHCSPTGGLLAVGGAGQVAFSPDDGATWGTPKLSHVSSVTTGPNCAAYITRQVSSDAFVAKVSVDGVIEWATFLGGSDQDAPVGLAVDAQGDVYVTGNTTSPDFPATAPLIGVTGQNAVFVTKFSTDGKLAYSALVSGEASNGASAIAVDPRQNAYILGSTNSPSFPVTAGTLVTKLAPGLATGFLLKLASEASLVYATLLGQSYTFGQALLVGADEGVLIAGTGSSPGLPAPPAGSNAPEFLIRLDPAASQIVSSTYLGGSRASALAYDPQGNVVVAGTAGVTNFAGTPGTYVSPPELSACAKDPYYVGVGANIIKLKATDWTPVFSALLSAPCGITPGAIAVDSEGAVALALSTANGLPLHNPLMGGPACGVTSSAVAKLSPDGSSLEFATYLDNCGAPGIALAPDGSLDVGVSPSRYGAPAGVLNLDTAKTPSISLDQIVNAFSGDGSVVVGGGLYSLTTVGLQAPTIDLGLNASQDLPTELGGVQVRFDGVPAPILHTSPGQVIVVPPSNLPASRGSPVRVSSAGSPTFTAVQLFANGVSSNVVWMPVAASRPGLLTMDFPSLPRYSISSNAVADAYNQDGTKNDADHPAALGSTITLFATGMGATDPPVDPGSIARSDSVTPVTPVYVSWKRGFSIGPATPEMVSSLPGFVSALFQIHIQVPASLQSLGGTMLPNGIESVPVGLYLALPVSTYYPPTSNIVNVFVK
jgi:uncharacterized protein (TIGR03437 family)